jgi:hypothetical protein
MTCNLPPTLTAEQKARICGVLSLGCDRKTAADLAGCSLAAIRGAIETDSAFAADIRRAEGGAELRHMRMVHQAADDVKNWRASVWWLERHAPERFGPRRAGEVTTRQLKAFTALIGEIVFDSCDDSDLRAKILAKLDLLSQSVEQLIRDEQSAENWGISLKNQLGCEPSAVQEPARGDIQTDC